ncbi:hypothetical protein L2E82_05914 [Cichorium intybus]|uniref:Uncharacterized protein n=1 Tax=Cichorium intybus TaxID=13427 RepID=A0ACB9H8H3_CICIN|nr:hypothetical protein L2E82_05914 [Cichorium intybus]
MASILITISLVFILLLIFGVISDALGGASFNPTVAVFYAAGLGRESLMSAAVRFSDQILLSSLDEKNKKSVILIVEIAKKHKILVIADKVYEHLAFREMKNSQRMRVL